MLGAGPLPGNVHLLAIVSHCRRCHHHEVTQSFLGTAKITQANSPSEHSCNLPATVKKRRAVHHPCSRASMRACLGLPALSQLPQGKRCPQEQERPLPPALRSHSLHGPQSGLLQSRCWSSSRWGRCPQKAQEKRGKALGGGRQKEGVQPLLFPLSLSLHLVWTTASTFHR